MQNVHPSKVKVTFQRPSCDYPYSGGFRFHCRYCPCGHTIHTWYYTDMGWTVEYLRTKQKDKKPQLLTYWISKSSNIECLLNVGLSSGFCPHPPDLHIMNKHQLYHAWTSASSSNRQISNQILHSNLKSLTEKHLIEKHLNYLEKISSFHFSNSQIFLSI